ncbi:uncharacterized protein [Paramisgurnus dabryanus]|uniref:uncharacterized protein n=1 Tax=Paramisgurnus dabryanus TaxID=90735 RepID=UPI0031F3723F
MFSDQYTRPADARPRREVRRPAWMEDYDIPPQALQQPSHLPPQTSNLPEQQQPYDSMVRFPERHARMTPLTPRLLHEDGKVIQGAEAAYSRQFEYSAPLYESTPASTRSRPAPETAPEVLEALHKLREDNQRLQQQLMDMHRRLDARSSQPNVPALQQTAPSPFPTSAPPQQQYNIEQDGAPYQTRPILPPARVGGHTLPPDDDDWPLPPPPIVDNTYQPPSQDLMAELITALRDIKTTRLQESPNRLEPPSPARPQTPGYCVPYTPQRCESLPEELQPSPHHELVYRGPKPTIPVFAKGDPREFARLKIALENLLPVDATERFKYQILVDHLKYEEALLIADSYTNSLRPYTDTMTSLIEHYGQPQQLALRKIADLMEAPNIPRGDTSGFKLFALKVRALVGLLDQLGDSGKTELHCGSHVTRLLSKLPHDIRAEFKRFLYPMRVTIPSLLHFSDWLDYELKMQETVYEPLTSENKGRAGPRVDRRRESKSGKNTNIMLTTDQPESTLTEEKALSSTKQPERTAYCPYCSNTQHFLDKCSNFAQLTVEQITAWIKTNKRCWRCGRSHQAAQCRLKITCHKCKGRHLQALHEVNIKPAAEDTSCLISTTNEVLYVDRRAGCSQVLLKVSKVLLRNGEHTLETYAILDDGSERTILLSAAAQSLKLTGEPENLILRTVRQDIRVLHGTAVSFSISPVDHPKKSFKIYRAFTADQLGLAEHTYSMKALQRKYKHLRGLPFQTINKVQPLLLIGSDYTHLITPVEPVRLGPHGGPAAVKTKLGWTLQGPTRYTKQQATSQQCLHISTLSSTSELLQSVERLWQLDVLPYRSEKLVTRSRQDQEAVRLLEAKTKRVEVDGFSATLLPSSE